MDSRQYRRFRKDMKSHTRECFKCGLPKRDSCKQSPCSAQHCACALTDPNMRD